MSVKPSYEAYKDMTAQGMLKGDIAVRFGISSGRLSQLVKEWREKAGEVMPEEKKAGRPKKEVKPAVKTQKAEDEFLKLAYDLKEKDKRLNTLESNLKEKQAMIDAKTKDQALLMKENGDLKKSYELYKEANEVKKEKIKELEDKLKNKEENHKEICEVIKERHIYEEAELENKYKNDLSAYKEKLAKSEESFVELMNSYNDVIRRGKDLEAKVMELSHQTLIPNEDETEKLRHQIECLEKTLMCYMPNGRG